MVLSLGVSEGLSAVFERTVQRFPSLSHYELQLQYIYTYISNLTTIYVVSSLNIIDTYLFRYCKRDGANRSEQIDSVHTLVNKCRHLPDKSSDILMTTSDLSLPSENSPVSFGWHTAALFTHILLCRSETIKCASLFICYWHPGICNPLIRRNEPERRQNLVIWSR